MNHSLSRRVSPFEQQTVPGQSLYVDTVYFEKLHVLLVLTSPILLPSLLTMLTESLHYVCHRSNSAISSITSFLLNMGFVLGSL